VTRPAAPTERAALVAAANINTASLNFMASLMIESNYSSEEVV